MPAEQLIILLKAPRPGLVKTRLAETMGAEAACAAYRELLETLFSNLSGLSEVELRFAPEDAQAQINPWLRPGWTIRQQGGGDLGCRLQSAFADAFSTGTQRVVVIGSDCPAVAAADIQEAWASLKTCDVVLGPATDGGYWLVGLRQPQPSLFDGISWSTGGVFAATLQRAREAGLEIHFLRRLTDVDTEADWQAFLASR